MKLLKHFSNSNIPFLGIEPRIDKIIVSACLLFFSLTAIGQTDNTITPNYSCLMTYGMVNFTIYPKMIAVKLKDEIFKLLDSLAPEGRNVVIVRRHMKWHGLSRTLNAVLALNLGARRWRPARN